MRAQQAKDPARLGGTIRIGGGAAIPALLREFGVDPYSVLAEAGVAATLFDDPDNMIPFATLGRLVSACVAKTGCEHFGLLVGQRNGTATLGLVGYLMQNSPDVESALRTVVRHLHLHDRGAVPILATQGGTALLGYAIYEPEVEAAEQITDGAIATAFNLLRRLCGPKWRPAEVSFTHRKPKDIGPFRRFFDVPLRFDAEQSAVAFSENWLKQPIPGADPELRRLLQKQVDEMEARYCGDFPHQVRRALRTAVLTRRAGADEVASLFSMHHRTLNRRLQGYGISFQQLADETRYEIARQMLGDSEAALGDVAIALGYAGASAFTRAFRRWSGTTPAHWRAQRRIGA